MSAIYDSVQLTPQMPIPANWSLADLQEQLGDIPAVRIRLNPPPGYATVDDVLRIEAEEDILCELEHGILVEKPMGWYESCLASIIIFEIQLYLRENRLGQVLGEGGSLAILPGIVKIPDVSFISWSRFPEEKVPRRPIPPLIPDLAVEVLSDSNTKKEMDAKLKKYFEAGVKLVWYVDPATRTAISHTGIDNSIEVPADGALDGNAVLPDFKLSLPALFQQADQQRPLSP